MLNQVLALITQALIILGFTTGFVGLHNLAWTKLTALAPSPLKAAGRVAMPVAIILSASLLIFIDNSGAVPLAQLAHHTLAVFMLTFIMFDEGINALEYSLRGVALLGLGMTYYADHFQSLGFLLMIAFLGFWFALVWAWRAEIRYHVWRHIAVIWSIAVVFWLTIPAQTFGLHFNLPLVLCAIGYSSIAIAVSGIYLHLLHRDAVQSEVNAKKATFDALTGVRTYAAFQVDVKEAFAQAKAKANEQALTVITIDIDHFKAVNDHYGHLAGNDILIGIAKVLQRAVVASDVAARLYRTGGEEFTIICRQTPAQAALPLARACWQGVRKSRFQAQGATITCTLSCGLAELKVTDTTAAELFSRADDNLYQSKARGRDTITSFGQAVVDLRPEQASETYTFFTQRIVDIRSHQMTIANEVRVGHYVQATEQWETVKTPQPLCVQLPFIQEVVKRPGDAGLSLTITAADFRRSQTSAQLKKIANSRRLWVTLRELPRLEELAKLVPRYHHQGIRIIIAGTPLKSVIGQLELALPLIDGIKTTLPDLQAAFREAPVPEAAMVAWYRKCGLANVEVIFTHLKASEDIDYVTQVLHGRYLQGYAFDQPKLPRLM